MKGLPTLIRVHKWQLEEKRRRLVSLEEMRDRWLTMIAQLGEEIRMEQEIAAADTEAGFAYGSYARAAIERRYKMEGALEEVRQQIHLAMDEVTSAYQELKKYEVAQAERKKREEKELNRREQGQLDDIAIEGFRRRAATAL